MFVFVENAAKSIVSLDAEPAHNTTGHHPAMALRTRTGQIPEGPVSVLTGVDDVFGKHKALSTPRNVDEGRREGWGQRI
jgi:hypothetical protein